MSRALFASLIILTTTISLEAHNRSFWSMGAGMAYTGLLHRSQAIFDDGEEVTGSFASQFWVGYNFNRCFGVELGYNYLGHHQITHTTHTESGFITLPFRSRSWTVPLRARFSYFATPCWEFLALLGANYFAVSSKLAETAVGLDVPSSQTITGFSFAYGVGAQYHLTRGFALRGSFNRYGVSPSLERYATTGELSLVYDF